MPQTDCHRTRRTKYFAQVARLRTLADVLQVDSSTLAAQMHWLRTHPQEAPQQPNTIRIYPRLHS